MNLKNGLTVRKITQGETPNAVCDICLKNGKVVRGTHDIDAKRPVMVGFFACLFHARRAVRWERVERISAAYRQQKRSKMSGKTVKV